MAFWCTGRPEFRTGDRIVSLVIHPPEIQSGTRATVISSRVGPLYAVQLPNGELHRWFAWFELQSVNPNHSPDNLHQQGEMVRILTEQGHSHHIKRGMIVKIVKVIAQVPFYDFRLEDGKYHRWLAEFEVTQLK